MNIVDIHEAKTHLSKLVQQAADGEPFLIAKAGKPLVRVVAVSADEALMTSRLGFMSGELVVPDDFDRMGQDQVTDIFVGSVNE